MRNPKQIYLELLVLQGQKGKNAALEELVNYWQPRLLRHSWYLTGDQEASLDIVQEAWVAVVKGIRKLEDPAHFRSWVYQIVTHKCADWVRRKTRNNKLKEEILQETKSSENFPGDEDNNELADLRKALNQLEQDKKALLALHYLEGMGLKEMSQILKIPEGTVKSRLYYARKELKETMERNAS